MVRAFGAWGGMEKALLASETNMANVTAPKFALSPVQEAEQAAIVLSQEWAMTPATDIRANHEIQHELPTDWPHIVFLIAKDCAGVQKLYVIASGNDGHIEV